MKKFKKLVPAICMLLVSAVMLGTTTFAWFSMNNKVTATGLHVTAKANTQYLVITNSLTDNKFPYSTIGKDTTSDTTAMAKDAASGILEEGNHTNKVYPVALQTDAMAAWYNGSKDAAEANKFKYSNNNTAANGDWFTANSSVYDAAYATDRVVKNAAKVGNAESTAETLSNYVLVYRAYVGLAANSDPLNDTTMTVSFTGMDGVNSAITVAMRVYNVGDAGKAKGAPTLLSRTDANTFGGLNFAASDIDAATGYVIVEAFVFINGFDDNVKSSNAAEISGNFGFSFEVTLK